MDKNWWAEEVLKSLRIIGRQGEKILGLSSQVEVLKGRIGELEAEVNVTKGSFDAFAQQVCNDPLCICRGHKP